MALQQGVIGQHGHFGSALKGHKSSKKKTLLASLMLTPMVDMFSLLVIFLLQFFAAQPDFLLTEGMDLPQAVSGLALRDAPVLTIGLEEAFLDQQTVGKVKDLVQNPGPLSERLAASRQLWLERNPGEEFLGEINLEAHRELSSATISRLMAVVAGQHFGTVHFLAFGE